MNMNKGENEEICDVLEDMAAAECIMVNQAMQEHRYQETGMSEKTINDIPNIFVEDELF